MPRPTKQRKVCCLPESNCFGPENNTYEKIIMSVEEYESIRLMDIEGMDQNGCAQFMGIARSTFQRIYTEARRKLAESLVNGKTLIIEGGNYEICSRKKGHRHCGKLCRWERK